MVAKQDLLRGVGYRVLGYSEPGVGTQTGRVVFSLIMNPNCIL
jgi:hypothetical protein